MAERIMTMNFAAIHTSSNVRWGYCLKKCLVLMRTYRVSRMRSYTWQRSPNTYNHYGKKSKLS